MKYLIYIALICLILFFVHKFLSKFKFPKTNALSVFTGAVKSGKSAVSLACAMTEYKRVHRKWKISCFFIKFLNLFRKKNSKFSLPEEPLFYSNVKLRNLPYCQLTLDHLLRKKRLNFRSVTYIDEASLVADSQLIRDKNINTQLLLFFKLYGHETHCGKLFLNSQSMSDLHYSIKRSTSQIFNIHHISRFIPFFTVCKMREERYSDDGVQINTYNEDVEDSLKTVIFRKRVFKFYDCCTFSIFTDELPCENIKRFYPKKSDIKTDKLVSFRPEFQDLSFFKEHKDEVQK